MLFQQQPHLHHLARTHTDHSSQLAAPNSQPGHSSQPNMRQLTFRSSHLTSRSSRPPPLTPHISQLTANGSQLTAHSSRLTAHSSQLAAHSSQLTTHSSHLAQRWSSRCNTRGCQWKSVFCSSDMKKQIMLPQNQIPQANSILSETSKMTLC